MDALLSTVQMPNGYPVATVAIDGAANAALLAAQILALGDENLSFRIQERRKAMAEKVAQADERFHRSFTPNR
jgi:5-(carboxyamino)imidazole ribonucleotide mutase